MTTNLPKRQRLLILAAGAGVLLLILDRVVFTPIGSLWESNVAEIRRLQESVTNGRSLIARQARLNGIWREIRSATLPEDQAKSEHDLISDFESWGRTSGVELGSINPLWRRGDTDAYSVLECRLDASGSLSELSRFLYELEKAPLALRTQSVELISQDSSGEKLTLSLTLSGLRLAPLEDVR